MALHSPLPYLFLTLNDFNVPIRFMVRLLHAMAGSRHGGAEAFFERLALALAAAGIRQHVLIRRDAERSVRLRDAGVEVTETRFGGPLDVLSRWRFRRSVAGFRPDIVLTWMNRASVACPASTPEQPFVHVGRLGGYYDLKYYRRCRHLIGNTPDICQWLVEQGRDPSTVHYLPNFADEVPAEAVMPQSPLCTAQRIVLALGRLHVNKAFDTLLRAMAQVPDATLWLAGAGPEQASLVALARQLGVEERVQFLGWRDDVTALHAQTDLFVCPSRHEPLGNVVLEAWAQGQAVVATASQGPSQMIQDGKNGLLVPIDDVSALAQAIRRVLENPMLRQQLATAGQEYYQQNFSQSAVIARYCEFFQRIAP